MQPTIIVQLEEQLPTEQMRATTLKEKLVERDKVLEESDNQLAEEDQLVVEKETQVVDVQWLSTDMENQPQGKEKELASTKQELELAFLVFSHLEDNYFWGEMM